MENLNSLKKLYGMNEIMLDKLLQQLKINLFPNNIDQIKRQLDMLMKQQISIKNQIPSNKFNTINNFIIELYSYLNEFRNNSVNKVYDLSNYHMDTSVINSKKEPERLNIPRMTKQPDTFEQTKLSKLGDIDPYKLYGYEKNQKIDINDLKEKYKKYALQTHPDKNNGETKNFIIVKECFRVIFEDYKLKKNDKQYNELKNDSLGYLEKQQKQNFNNKKIDKNSFNIHKFNKVYNDNKIENVNDNGYDNWRDDNKFDSDDIQKDANLTMNNFHDRFNSNVKISKDIIHYEKPRELFMNADNNCEELGKNSIDNYSGKTKNISYTDYKEAHTTTKLVDTNIDFKTYKNVDELKHSRENIKELTSEEIMNIELEKNRKEQLEQDRIGHMRHMDGMYSKQYDRIHNIMLK